MLEYINPAELVIADNIRREAQQSLDAQFLRSIRERGVLQAITADRDEAGTLTVRYGHRRTLAAQYLGLPEVPVDVRDETQGDADRIIDQLIENDQRRELSGSDRVRAVAQLALTGMSARQIAKQAAMRPKAVQNALTIAHSERALGAADTLTLEQAAALVEFEDDPEAIAELESAAEQGQFDHELSRQRLHRAETAAEQQVAAWIEAQGVRVIEAPSPWENPTAAKLAALTDPEGNPLTEEDHAGCPGHVGWARHGRRYYGEADSLPEGAVNYGERGYFFPEFGCEDWRGNGHRNAYDSKAPKESLTAEQAEARKIERRRVIDNNRAWDACEMTRREWLAKFATRKSAPAGAEQLIARALLGGWEARVNTWKPIGIEPTAFVDEVTAGTTKARAIQIALCLALYRWESNTGRHTWRNSSERDRTVLTALQGWGYPLSEVEAEIIA